MLLMRYESLCNEILKAMDSLQETGGIPKTIYLAPNAFEVLKQGYWRRCICDPSEEPRCFGMKVKVRDLPENVIFYLAGEDPLSDMCDDCDFETCTIAETGSCERARMDGE